MHVADFDAVFVQVFGQVFRHFLGQGGYQHPFAFQDGFAAFFHQVVNLVFDRADQADGVGQPGRADDLFDENAFALFHFPVAGSGGNEYGLRPHAVPFLQFQRPVVKAGGQAEAVFRKRSLAVAVAAVHAADLRYGNVAFVDKQQSVRRQVFKQRRRRLAGRAAGQITGIVFDPLAMAGGFQHFEVKAGALLQPLGFKQFVVFAEIFQLRPQFLFDAGNGLGQGRPRGNIMAGRVNHHFFEVGGLFAGQGVEFADAFDFVAEEGNAPGAVFQVSGKDIEGVALHAESAADEVELVAFVLQFGQPAVYVLRFDLVAGFELERHRRIGSDVAQTVDAGNGGDDNDVAAFKNAAGGGVAHAVDLLVDGGIFFDICVGFGNVGFRLIIIVVGNEIFHMVVRKELFHFAVKLGGKDLVGRHD